MNSTLKQLISTSRNVLKFRPRYTSRDYFCSHCEKRLPHYKFDMLELIQINMGMTGICKTCENFPYYKLNSVRISSDVSSIARPSSIRKISDHHELKASSDDITVVVYGIEMVDEDSKKVESSDKDMDYSLSTGSPLSQIFLTTEEKETCYLCHDEDTDTHVSCLKCKKQFHVQCLRSLYFDECPFCKKTWKRSSENARVQDLLLLQRKRDFLSNMLLNVRGEIELYTLGLMFDKEEKKYQTIIMETDRHREHIKRLKEDYAVVEQELFNTNGRLDHLRLSG